MSDSSAPDPADIEGLRDALDQIAKSLEPAGLDLHLMLRQSVGQAPREAQRGIADFAAKYGTDQAAELLRRLQAVALYSGSGAAVAAQPMSEAATIHATAASVLQQQARHFEAIRSEMIKLGVTPQEAEAFVASLRGDGSMTVQAAATPLPDELKVVLAANAEQFKVALKAEFARHGMEAGAMLDELLAPPEAQPKASKSEPVAPPEEPQKLQSQLESELKKRQQDAGKASERFPEHGEILKRLSEI